ncbi:GDYXXLXY domain-containing protein [Pararhizobium sp.]|uniref:GDYXXLXY domain-containing protein n=1 Tax=Pararhizobium sp. TaxID=1977563 RepID=UPI002716013D|nr:GDYXXLXY domain-containing protein [Pararhizobium sp.]MDO9415367.1 GDYXXLXY domain-containing protein [Pararhizobium sp.]
MRKSPFVSPLVAALIIAALQTAFLGYMVESRASILRNGSDVLLKTAPVDPRDFLRGDYVILSYDVSTIPVGVVTGGYPAETGPVKLAVRLEKQADGFWGVTEASFADLPARDGSVILKTAEFTFYPVATGDPQQVLNVQYGIERYYVPEGEGRVLEDARNQNALSVAARVSAAGQAQIRQISIDGKPIYEEPLY